MSNTSLSKKDKVKGKVVKLSLPGAFIDLGEGAIGFLHISQIKEEPVRNVQDVLSIGQEVEGWVRRVDERTGRVEITLMEPNKYEWRDLTKGMTVSGIVESVEKFGATVNLGAEVPGFVHVSEMAHDFVRSADDIVSVGQEIEAMVLEVNRRRKQIKLSIKALIEPPVVEVEEAYEIEDENDEPAPTALELALKKAMEGSSSDDKKNSKSGNKSSNNEMDDIIKSMLDKR